MEHCLFNTASLSPSVHCSNNVLDKRMRGGGREGSAAGHDRKESWQRWHCDSKYSVVQKNSYMFEFPAFLPPSNLGLPNAQPISFDGT